MTRALLTLVFTDVEGSTALRSAVGDSRATVALQRHEALVRRHAERHRGRVVKSLGDGLLLAFSSPGEAISCAVAVQDEQSADSRRDGEVPLAVRIGMTTGEVDDDGGDLRGQAVHAAARIMARAAGGDVLVAEVTAQLAGPVSGVRYVDRGRVSLRGLTGRWRLFGLEWEAEPAPSAAPVDRLPPRRPTAAELVGRRAQLAQIEAAVAKAAAGEFRWLLVVGDAGVGKSRLAAATLAQPGVLGLTARAYPLGATDSFGVWLEALEGHLRGLPPEEVRRLCGAYIDDLAGVLPSARTARGAPNLGEPPRSRLLQGLAALLDALARDRALVVVLDDVHLADDTSWEALGWFARNLRDARILVVATARPAELRRHHAATAVLHGLEQDGCAETIALAGLELPELTDLARTTLGATEPPGPLVAWLADRSRGNPLYALGLLRALVEEGADLAAPTLRKLPEDLADRVAARIAVLDEPTRATLETLAVLGSRVEVSDLVALSGRPLDRLAPILDELAELRLIGVDERGRELVYEISHPLIQEAIYERVGSARRRALHRRVARELVGLGRLAMAAPHFARSADAGDDEAVKALGDAVRQAEERELYREALAMMQVLKDILPAGDDRWLEILDALSWKADWVVEHRADLDALHGIEALQEIVGLLEGTRDRVTLAGVQLRLATFLAWGAGEIDPARRLVSAALDAFEAAGERQRALLARNELAWLVGMGGDHAALADAAKDVVERADRVGDRFVQMQALGILASAELSMGAFRDGEAHLRQSIAIAEEDGKRYRRNWNLGFVALSLAYQGRVAEAQATMADVRADPQHVEAIAVEMFASAQLLLGDYAALLQIADDLADRYPSGVSRRRGQALAYAGMAAAEMGRDADARRWVAAAQAVFGGRRWFNEKDVCDWASGVVALTEGRTDAAVAGLAAVARVVLESSNYSQVLPVVIDLLEACAACGDVETARAFREAIDRADDHCEGPLFAAFAALARAELAFVCGSLPDAAALASEAADAFGRLGSPAYHGRALALGGQASGASNREHAAELLGQAADVFASCGAIWRRDRVLAQLGHLGARGRRRVAAARGPAGLTDRERDVARLAAHGLTAKEIAARLFVGERTVETHLANSYAKLGVRSKQELQRRAAEFDL